MWAKRFSVEYVFTKATSDTSQASDILTELLDSLHLFINKLLLQPVGQLCKQHSEQNYTATIFKLLQPCPHKVDGFKRASL